MKVTIMATEKLTNLDGVPVRVWEGVTEGGTACIVFVHRIAVRADEDAAEFERELKERMPPGRAIDLRQVL